MKEHERLELEYIKNRYFEKYPNETTFKFNSDYDDYLKDRGTERVTDIMKYKSEYLFNKAFKSIGVTNDVKAYVDTLIKILHGRYEHEPDLITCPNLQESDYISTIKFKIQGLDNELIPFNGDNCLIAYRPKEICLNANNFAYYAEFISANVWDQDSLAESLYNKIVKAINTEDVYIVLNSKHLNSQVSSEFFGGIFNESEMRLSVRG